MDYVNKTFCVCVVLLCDLSLSLSLSLCVCVCVCVAGPSSSFLEQAHLSPEAIILQRVSSEDLP